MRKLVFLCLLFIICCGEITAQVENALTPFSNSTYIPAAETYTTSAIANFVNKNCKSDKEKLQVIYHWVTTNIRYDKDSMYHINWSMEQADKIAATLRRKKGVCENYAALFTDIVLKTGIQSFVINGYTKQGGIINWQGHSWCAVKLADDWWLCDPTWDEGKRANAAYFLIHPTQFIETHIPFDPLWQLLEHPVNINSHEKNGVNFKEAINDFLLMDSLQQLQAAAKRIHMAGIKNERQKNWAAFNQMKIAIIYADQDMKLYNAAVDDLNKATVIFNKFVSYRNAAFVQLKSDAEINSLLKAIPLIILTANEKLNKIGKSTANSQYDTGLIEQKLSNLSDKVIAQQIFLNRYLVTNIEERNKLFYK